MLDDLQRCLPVPEVREMIYRLILQPEPDEDTIIVSVYNPAFYYPVRPEEIDLVDDEEADVTFTNPPKPVSIIKEPKIVIFACFQNIS